MIQPGTILNVADNSGAKKINCITVLGGYKKATAGIGDVIVASVREVKRQVKGQVSKVQKGQVVHCVIVRTRKEKQVSSGFSHASAENAAVLIDSVSKNPIGTRVLGPVTDELKKSGFGKIVNMSSLSAF
jgi:large subunit ribosomal protein L14|tara:strand:- start:1439 stop:1828 length:390 start_codon:yes stop_codon:yes gene_type:complete